MISVRRPPLSPERGKQRRGKAPVGVGKLKRELGVLLGGFCLCICCAGVCAAQLLMMERDGWKRPSLFYHQQSIIIIARTLDLRTH